MDDARLLRSRLGMARVRLAVLDDRARRGALTVDDQRARHDLEARVVDLERELGAQLALPGIAEPGEHPVDTVDPAHGVDQPPLALLGPDELAAAR